MTAIEKLAAGSAVDTCRCPRCGGDATAVALPSVGWAAIRCDPCNWRASLRVDEAEDE